MIWEVLLHSLISQLSSLFIPNVLAYQAIEQRVLLQLIIFSRALNMGNLIFLVVPQGK